MYGVPVMLNDTSSLLPHSSDTLNLWNFQKSAILRMLYCHSFYHHCICFQNIFPGDYTLQEGIYHDLCFYQAYLLVTQEFQI